MRYLSTCLLLLAPLTASAAPMEMAHQGRLMDALGQPMTGNHDLTISIYDVVSGGSAVWSDTMTGVAFNDGFYSVTLAGLDATDFEDDDLWVGLTVDAGTELPTRLKLTAVPYALNAYAVSGGMVNATEVQVNGTTIIDSSGKIDFSSLGSVPTGISDGDSDTLADITGCSNGDVLQYSSGAWSCGAVSGTFDASAIVSGTMNVNRLPVGDTTGTVAAGDHTHDVADITGAATIEDGSTAASAAASCKAILNADPRAASGNYFIDPVGDGSAIKVACDMDMLGGGWVDVVATFGITGQNITAVNNYFFDGQGTITAEYKNNVDGTPGILLTTNQAGSHAASFYLMPDSLRYVQTRTTWRMQGSDTDSNRCSNGNWIPLNGPGWNGGYTASYLAACPSGYTCIQGSSTSSRDAPVSASYANDSMTSANEILTWSGSNTGAQSLNCARDPKIPTDVPALFITQLLLR